MGNLKKIVFLGAFFFIVSGCSKSTLDVSSAVPNVTVNVSININSSGYGTLSTIGGICYLANEGYRGILLYRLNSTTIMAYDRTCTYNISTDAGGIVVAQTNGTAICLDCNSEYSLTDGSVVEGPSTLGLKVYTAKFTPATGALTVTN